MSGWHGDRHPEGRTVLGQGEGEERTAPRLPRSQVLDQRAKPGAHPEGEVKGAVTLVDSQQIPPAQLVELGKAQGALLGRQRARFEGQQLVHARNGKPGPGSMMQGPDAGEVERSRHPPRPASVCGLVAPTPREVPQAHCRNRLPRHLVIATGLVVFAIGYLGLGVADEAWLVFVLLPVYGAFAALTDGVGKAWISSLAPDDRQGWAQGLYQSLSGGAILIAGLWAGLAWNGTGQIALLISGVVALAVAGYLVARGSRFTAIAD